MIVRILELLLGRVVSCSGGCGRTWRVRDRGPEVTAAIECASCYYRRWGIPAEGFVGFGDDGTLRTMRRG